MNDQNLAQFEARLERLIEGAFAHVFSKGIRAQDIALHLARAMESAAEPSDDGDPRPLAPDLYAIYINPDERDRLLARRPDLPQVLAQHLVELATESGYRLVTLPTIELIADAALGSGRLAVEATHTNHQHHSTAIMERIELSVAAEPERPRNAQLIINGSQTVALQAPIVNLGRSRDNHIVLDDPYISRHHGQLRLRFGRYILFDVQSQTGTFVNDVQIREHQLQSGDVIRMGRMQLVYLDDDPSGESQTSIHLKPDL